MMFLNCPARLDQGARLCGLPAEVRCRFVMRSTDGPLESAMIRCPVGHCFSGPIESLSLDSADKHDPGPARAGSRAGRSSLDGPRTPASARDTAWLASAAHDQRPWGGQ